MRHEVLVELFRNRPTLAAELLVEALDVTLPPYAEARMVSADLTDVQPAQYRADAVVLLFDEGKPVRVNIVEVQLGTDPDKRFSWPHYLTECRRRHRCPVDLLIVAPDSSIADWCAEPIEIGPPGFVLKPPVLQSKLVPIVTDPAEAARRPELAVLSAMAHGNGPSAPDIVQAVVPVLEQLDLDRSTFYLDLVYHSVNEAVRRALEAKMKGYECTSPIAKRIVEKIREGRDLALDEGRKLGVDEGRKLGVDEGRKLGVDETLAHNLLTLLDTRGVDMSEAARDQILNEHDTARLSRWFKRAITASTLAEVFEEST